jgi:hypothetical protein
LTASGIFFIGRLPEAIKKNHVFLANPITQPAPCFGIRRLLMGAIPWGNDREFIFKARKRGRKSVGGGSWNTIKASAVSRVSLIVRGRLLYASTREYMYGAGQGDLPREQNRFRACFIQGDVLSALSCGYPGRKRGACSARPYWN